MTQGASVAILGAGAFGTALAVALSGYKQQVGAMPEAGTEPAPARPGGSVTLWARDVRWGRNNPRLPGVTLPDEVHLTDDLAAAVRADTLLLALPAQSLGGFLDCHAHHLAGKRLVSTAKGIDLTSLTGPSALLARNCPTATISVLTGPSFAADIARGLPTALTLACADQSAGQELQHRLSTPVLRLYLSQDVTGAELGGALKNVIAIAAGVVIGAGLGDSARAAIITRGFAEMTRLATYLGARPETLTGLSGLGDLTLTCTSDQSRNFRYGAALGARRPFDAATTVEGAATARAVAAMSARSGKDMPIAAMVAGLAEGRITPEDAAYHLMNRPLKEE